MSETLDNRPSAPDIGDEQTFDKLQSLQEDSSLYPSIQEQHIVDNVYAPMQQTHFPIMPQISEKSVFLSKGELLKEIQTNFYEMLNYEAYQTQTIEGLPPIITRRKKTNHAKYTLPISCILTESHRCNACLSAAISPTVNNVPVCVRDSIWSIGTFAVDIHESWNYMIKQGVTGSWLNKNNIPLHYFASIIRASGKSIRNILFDLKVTRKHLKNGLFFDPQKMAKLFDTPQSEYGLLEDISYVLEQLYAKKKSNPYERGLLYCDIIWFGWNAEDIIALNCSYQFLYKIGMRHKKDYLCMSEMCNIGKEEWQRMNMEDYDLQFLTTRKPFVHK